MKKILMLIAVLLTWQSPALAQSDDGEFLPVPKPKKHAFFIGPKIGMTMTTMGQPNESDLYDGFGIGFSGGLALKARFNSATESSEGGTGFVGLGLELKYKKNSVKTTGTDESGKENANLSVDYFEVPIYLQVYPLAKSKKMNTFYFELGASMAGTMARSPKSLTAVTAGGSDVVYNFDTEGSKLKGYDVRPLVGLGYTFHSSKRMSGLDVNARYYIGTSDLAGNFPCKMNSFEISLAYMFKL